MLFSKVLKLTGGATGETFGTAGSLTLNADARRVIAIVHSGADVTYTTAEGAAELLRISSTTLSGAGLPSTGASSFVVGPYTTSGPATNGSGQSMVQEIIPVNWSAQGSDILSIDAAATNTVTTARRHLVQILYVDSNEPPADWWQKFPSVLPATYPQSDAITAATTTTRTTMATLKIPAWAREIIGIKAMFLKSGAITGGEEVLGFMDFESTIRGIAPQEWITNALGATLGTPVGTGLYHERVPYIPAYIPLTGKNEDLTPFYNLDVAVTTANIAIASVLMR